MEAGAAGLNSTQAAFGSVAGAGGATPAVGQCLQEQAVSGAFAIGDGVSGSAFPPPGVGDLDPHGPGSALSV
jgi:hypothetical protein